MTQSPPRLTRGQQGVIDAYLAKFRLAYNAYRANEKKAELKDRMARQSNSPEAGDAAEIIENRAIRALNKANRIGEELAEYCTTYKLSYDFNDALDKIVESIENPQRESPEP